LHICLLAVLLAPFLESAVFNYIFDCYCTAAADISSPPTTALASLLDTIVFDCTLTYILLLLHCCCCHPHLHPPQLFNQILSRGSYQVKVESDLQQHRPALEALAASVAAFTPDNMEQMVEFVSQHQQQLLDQLYDERAVLKQIGDWPAAKWEAMWEGVVVYGQMLELQQMCLKHEAPLLSSNSSSSSSAATPGKAASSLADAAAAAQKTCTHVVSKLEAFQRQESAFVKRMRAQGIPWQGQKLVAAVKEASVQLGTCYVSAVLGMLAEAESKLLKQMEKDQLAAAAAASAATAAAATPAAAVAENGVAAANLWGCEVRDPKQQQRLQQRSARQLAQHKQKREQQLDEAVSFVFKLHQFAGGLDEPCRDAFLQLVEQVEATM
jgi:hypothetical protein